MQEVIGRVYGWFERREMQTMGNESIRLGIRSGMHGRTEYNWSRMRKSQGQSPTPDHTDKPLISHNEEQTLRSCSKARDPLVR